MCDILFRVLDSRSTDEPFHVILGVKKKKKIFVVVVVSVSSIFWRVDIDLSVFFLNFPAKIQIRHF